MFHLVAILALFLETLPKVHLEPAENPRAVFRVEGDITQAQFQVFTIADPSRPIPKNTPTLLGKYETLNNQLTFRPKYPLDRGLTYRAVIDIPDQTTRTFDFQLKPLKKEAPSTIITKVSPTPDLLPENLLKFYIEFSKPISRGESYEHITLTNEKGKPLELPFLELTEELWDPSGKRFTLLLDPARIKQGLRPREEEGPVLEDGKSYTLVIDQKWQDAKGLPLVKEFRKTFKVGPPDATSPDPKTWTIVEPKPGTNDPFTARFPEPLDSAMLGRVLAVFKANGEPVPGRIDVASDQKAWSFHPDRNWQPGGYLLRVGKTLEDLAGNSVGRPFEVDLTKKSDSSEEGYVDLKWEVTSH